MAGTGGRHFQSAASYQRWLADEQVPGRVDVTVEGAPKRLQHLLADANDLAHQRLTQRQLGAQPSEQGQGQGQGQEASGGMNFSSKGAYQKWLAYGHATGEFEDTPGDQQVSVKGKTRTVQHIEQANRAQRQSLQDRLLAGMKLAKGGAKKG